MSALLLRPNSRGPRTPTSSAPLPTTLSLPRFQHCKARMHTWSAPLAAPVTRRATGVSSAALSFHANGAHVLQCSAFRDPTTLPTMLNFKTRYTYTSKPMLFNSMQTARGRASGRNAGPAGCFSRRRAWSAISKLTFPGGFFANIVTEYSAGRISAKVMRRLVKLTKIGRLAGRCRGVPSGTPNTIVSQVSHASFFTESLLRSFNFLPFALRRLSVGVLFS